MLSLGQGPRPRAIASPHQLQQRVRYIPPVFDSPISQHGQVSPPLSPRPTGTASKVTAVSPVLLGTASNVFTILRPEQNQIIAIDSLDLVAFIHRNDINVYGGSSGNLRYDVSLDGGQTFSNDLGVMNPLLTRNARYPNIAGLNLPGGSNPLNAGLVYGAPTLDNANTNWDGVVVGLSDIILSGSPNSTEHYLAQGAGTHLPGGLCQSAPGIFWMVEFEGDGTVAIGDVRIYRGEYNTTTSDVDWVVADTLDADHYTGFDGTATMVGPNIAFSPDGQTGWIGWLGDIVGGQDSSLLPILSKTTDCGVTWSTPIEVNLNTIPWIKDSLQTLWTDSLGNPASDGRATCAFDYDMTVDADGNPHLAVVICSGAEYAVSSALAKFLGDVTSHDGGATWDVSYISPVLTFRTPAFGTNPQVVMDNYVQVARDEGGCNIFFSWADSDTALVTGNGNGIGFGESINLAPNLRIAAKNVPTGQQTYPKLISDLDLIWDGAILFPTMAPIVLSESGGWKLPIVAAAMAGQNPVNQATFNYFGNDATISNANWCTPSTMSLSWDVFGMSSFVSPCAATPVAFCNAAVNGPCVPVGIHDPLAAGIVLGDAYPNPTTGTTRITFTLPTAQAVTLTLHNSIGQTVAVLAQGDYPGGVHAVEVQSQSLAVGLYMFELVAGDYAISKKLVVTR